MTRPMTASRPEPTIPPPPGSAAARALGCRCPILDNEDLAWTEKELGERRYVISGACPLHGARPRSGNAIPKEG